MDRVGAIQDLIRSVEMELNRPVRILVIDDEENCYLLFARAFNGCEVDWAMSGVEGLGHLERNPERYDAIVVDERLPDIPGHMVLKQIRERWPALFTVACSGLDFDEHMRTMLAELDPLMFLKKPIRGEAVESLLKFIKERRG